MAVLIMCTPLQAQLPRLMVHEDGRHLVTADGKPFFYLADTGWEMLHRLTQAEIRYYLTNRAAKGFNVIQTVILGECNGLTEPNAVGHLPFHDLDPDRPNEAFFELVDYAVETAAGLGIYLALLPTWGAHAEDRPHGLFDNVAPFTEENINRYGRFLAQRYLGQWR